LIQSKLFNPELAATADFTTPIAVLMRISPNVDDTKLSLSTVAAGSGLNNSKEL
jgi:hypothetical protein